MAASPPPPPADDEVERRLAALKAGADPASLGPPPGRAAGKPGASASPPPADEPPALVGEVIEPGAGRGPPGGTGPSDTPPAGPGGLAVAWGISQAQAGRLGLWIGVALVGFGAYLVLAELVPGIATLGSLALAIGGGALVAWHLAGRAGTWALHVGAILAGFGGLRLVADVTALPSAGWGTLGAGLGLLAIAVLRAARRQGVGWQAWVGGALAVWGGWGVLGATIPGFPTFGDLVVPLVLVLLGIAVLRRGVRPGPGAGG